MSEGDKNIEDETSLIVYLLASGTFALELSSSRKLTHLDTWWREATCDVVDPYHSGLSSLVSSKAVIWLSCLPFASTSKLSNRRW